MNANTADIDTVIVGGGQAGLATAWQLQQLGRTSLVLEAGQHVGDQWRARWDSLQLFTPARYSALPGAPHPEPDAYLGKGAFADYLAKYAERFALPVRCGVRVSSVAREGDRWLIATSDGEFSARQVVVASGANPAPFVPPLAAALDREASGGNVARQLHSHDYRNPAQIADGEVLVVGAGTSGAEIALELAATHRVAIAGRPTPHIPEPVLRYAGGLYWAFINGVLTRGTPIGRRVAGQFHDRGAPLLRISMTDLERSGVARLPRLVSASAGSLTFSATGASDPSALTRPSPSTIIWATGYHADFSWFPALSLDKDGWPVTVRGIVKGLPGVYTVGMPFQWGLTSGLIGGVGRDAESVALAIAASAA